MRDKVEQQLKCLQTAGIIEQIQSSDWAAPIVPVLKHDKKTIHLCRNYHLTVNRAVKIDQYPILKIEDLLNKIAGGKYFTSFIVTRYEISTFPNNCWPDRARFLRKPLIQRDSLSCAFCAHVNCN